MTDAEQIEDTLRAQLPAALHACVPALAAVIADLEAGRITPAEAGTRLRAEVFAPLRAQFAGQALEVGAARLNISPGGDNIIVGNIDGSEGVAVGPGAHAQVVKGDKNIVVGPGGFHVTLTVPEASTRSRSPFMAPDLPADFVPRPDEFERIVARLLDSGADPVAISAALRGAGGYGKTTLAAAVCRDLRVRAAFPDGILWITLGEKPTGAELVGQIEDLALMLSGEPRAGFVSLEAATTRLAEILGKRRMLIVVDDVWDTAHLRPFLHRGAHTARLITTRNRDTLPITTRAVDVDAMRQDEALGLLSAGITGATAHVEALQALATRLGEWPLLLKIVNGVLREQTEMGETLVEAIAYVNTGLDEEGITVFDTSSAEGRQRAVARTLEVSLATLSDTDQARFAELAIFGEDVSIPLATLQRYWGAIGGLSAFAVKRLATRLYNRSLLLSYNPSSQIIRLHDVVRAYLCRVHGPALAGWHRSLLEAHRPSSGAWVDVPDTDRYLWEYLLYHLEHAEYRDELVRLVTDSHWWSARRGHDLTSFKLTQDLDAARQVVRRSGRAKLAQYTLLCFLQAYLGSLVSNLPVEVVECLACAGQDERAYNLANLFTDESLRVSAWWRLGQYYLDQGDTEKALTLLLRARDRVLLQTKNKHRPNHLARFAFLFYRAGRPDEAQRCLDQAVALMEPLSDQDWSTTFTTFVRGMYDYPSDLLQPCLDRAVQLVHQRSCHPLRRSLVLARIAEQQSRINIPLARIQIAEAIIPLQMPLLSPSEHDDSQLMDSEVEIILGIVANVVFQVGQEDVALNLLNRITSQVLRVEALMNLGSTYVDQGPSDKARARLTETAQLVETALEGAGRDAVRCVLVKQFLRIPDLVEAERIAQTIQDAMEQIEAICTLLAHLSKLGQVIDAERWLARLETPHGHAVGQAAIGMGLMLSDPDAAIMWLRAALRSAKEIQEGVVGSRHSAYTYIARCIRDAINARREQALTLLRELIDDLQAEPGVNAIAHHAIQDRRDDALGRAAEALAAAGHYTEGAHVTQGIRHATYRDMVLLTCVRYACLDHDWNGANRMLDTITTRCWQTIGHAIRDVAITPPQVEAAAQHLREVLAGICTMLPDSNNAFSFAATELGLLGHVPWAQTLMELTTNPVRRHEAQVELVRLLAQANRMDSARQIADSIEYSNYRAEAFAQMARALTDTNVSQAQALVEQARNLLNPYQLPPEHWTSSWHTEEVVAVLAGTVARWSVDEADEIVVEWILKPEHRLRAWGEIAAALTANNPQGAYTRSTELLDQAVAEGLGDFWLTLEACAEALMQLIPADQIVELFHQIWAAEQWLNLSV